MRKFLAELKRRHVFRVATVYLVVAWVVIQVATTVLPILGLPRWVLTAIVVAALVGFPITLVVSWAFDLTREGIEVTDQPGKRFRLPWLRRSFAGIFVLIAIFVGYALYLRVKPAEAVRTPSVAVFPFSVTGGASVEYLREGIVNLLATSFNGIGTMRSVDPTTLLNSLSQTQRLGVDRKTAQRVASEVGATAFVIGEIIEKSENEITLTATFHNVDDEKAPPATVSVSGRPDEILDKVDQLAGLLLTGQMQDEASRLSRTAALTTHKLSALKAYLQGEAEYREARWPTAMSFFRRALDDDTTFALAAYRLAVAADWASQFDTARVAVARALRHSKRLSAHDRDLLLAFNAALRGRADEAEDAYKRLTTDYPDDVEAWYRYGEVLYHYNPVRGRSVFESRPMFERALRGAPDVEPMVLHLMELALYQADYQAFDRYAQQIDSTKPAAIRRIAVRRYADADANGRAEIEKSLKTARDGDLFVVASGLAQFREELLAADRLSELLTSSERVAHVRGSGHLLRAQFALARGQWEVAKTHLRELADAYPGVALAHEALYASIPIFNVDDQQLQALRTRLTEWKAESEDSIHAPTVYLAAHNGMYPVLRHYLLGVLAARAGDRTAAARAADALAAVTDSSALPLARRLASAVRAHAAFHQNDAAGALKLLERAPVDANLDLVYNSIFWNGAVERFLRAEALRALKRDIEAKSWYASLAEGRNEVFLAAPAHLRLAEIAEGAGQRDTAAVHYRKFAELWRSADPAMAPHLQKARAYNRPVAYK